MDTPQKRHKSREGKTKMSHTNVSKHYMTCPGCGSIIKRTEWFEHRTVCPKKATLAEEPIKSED
jgi:acetyl-CoA carboxylase beta subunit